MDSLSNVSKKQFISRANQLMVGIFLFGLLIVGRLFFLTVLKHDFYENKVVTQQKMSIASMTRRKEIYLTSKSSLFPLAINKKWPMVYAEPSRMTASPNEKIIIAEELANILKIDKESILKKILNTGDPFEPIKYKLTPEEISAINGLNIHGLKIQEEELRYYPGEQLASHVVGFLGNSDDGQVGQYGVEEYYNNFLANNDHGTTAKTVLATSSPNDLVLTIDANIQLFVEEELKKTIEEYSASGGTSIVMDSQSGSILAMANFPDFNPNQYAKASDFSVFLNNAVSSSFEPGSVFKPIVMSIALDKNVVMPMTTYVDQGFVKIGGYTIYNADQKKYGLQNMTQVLEKSLNTGLVFVEKLLDKETMKQYFKRFGFGEKTGIDLPNEASGNFSNLDSGRDINFATASFGQGVSVTPIQLVRAIGAIANRGRLVFPKVVENDLGNDNILGDANHLAEEETVQVISEDTANRLVAMLVSVAENGSGKKARISGYSVAVKTGTAQIPYVNKKGYSEETTHTVIGFSPAYNTKLVVLTKIDRPKIGRFAETTAAPLFKKIMEYALNYLEIPPDK